MALKFTPQTEEQLQRSRLLPEGAYPFSVAESAEKASKSAKNPGRMMAALKLVIHAPDGDVFQSDHFADWFGAYKLRHFADSIGRLSEYDKGALDFSNNTYQGATGYLMIGEQKRQDTGGLQNTVKDYLTKEEYQKETGEEPQAKATPAQAAPEETDDVPF